MCGCTFEKQVLDGTRGRFFPSHFVSFRRGRPVGAATVPEWSLSLSKGLSKGLLKGSRLISLAGGRFWAIPKGLGAARRRNNRPYGVGAPSIGNQSQYVHP